MKLKLNYFRKTFLFISDFILWNFAYYCAFLVIYRQVNITQATDLFSKGIVAINVCFISTFFACKMYNKIWRYADVADFFYEWLACIFANVLFYVYVIFTGMKFGIVLPSVIMLFSTFYLLMFRFTYRVYIMSVKKSHLNKSTLKKVLIIGAGEATSILLRELANNPYNEYKPICIIDDDNSKKGRSIFGVKILGGSQDIPVLCKKYKINCIIFAIPSMDSKQRKRIIDICKATNAELKVIPSIYKTMDKDFDFASVIRDVEVEDLLGRDEIKLETDKCKEYIENRTVLVTGGGGSIGSELCRQISKLNPKKLIILDIYENNAYEIQQELRRHYGNKLDYEVQIASIRDYDKLEELFKTKNIDVVFHAAAHKHVPLMETNPEEAIKNNVFGTYNVITLSDKYKVKRFVLISTDKAVNPTNVMGCTKRICEMLIQHQNKISQTQYVAVRFGNVLGSNGSVIPLFKNQLKEGGPITVTHPDIIRYFMTIPEAVALVLSAGSMAKGGEIFVLDMGDPIRIDDLAKNLIRLSGLELGKDIEIKYTGLRPGEKLYEEMLMDEEGITKTDNKKICIGHPIDIDEDKLMVNLKKLKISASNNDQDAIENLLYEIVPTFHHNKGDK